MSKKRYILQLQISRNFSYNVICGRAMARSSSDDNAIRYVLPVLWMTSCFHITEQMCQNQRRRIGQCFVQFVNENLINLYSKDTLSERT